MSKHQLLTVSERELLIAIPTDHDELVRIYTLEPADIDLISLRRKNRNRLGVALQLATLRHPGMTLAQILNHFGVVPDALLSFLAGQLDLPISALADYACRDQTMTDHARELAEALGQRGALRTDIPFMIEVAAKAAWSTEGEPQNSEKIVR
jgi:TnpA family transposase